MIYLRKIQKDLAAARSFMNRCAKGESKTVLSVTFYSMESLMFKTMCKNKRERQNVIEGVSKCYNSGSNDGSKCWTKMISTMTAVGNLAESKDKIPSLCWLVFQLNVGAQDILFWNFHNKNI